MSRHPRYADEDRLPVLTRPLDIEEWREAVERTLPYRKWAVVMGELEFMGAVLDDAMASIFTTTSRGMWRQANRGLYLTEAEFNRQRRAEDLEWLLESTGELSAREICATLAYVGWTKTRRGWPVDHTLLCEAARRGLAMGLHLYPKLGRPAPKSPETRAKISAARKSACATAAGHALVVAAIQRRYACQPATRSRPESVHV